MNWINEKLDNFHWNIQSPCKSFTVGELKSSKEKQILLFCEYIEMDYPVKLGRNWNKGLENKIATIIVILFLKTLKTTS